MINLLKDIIQMSRNLQLQNKPGSSLLTALITGSPGSGKDTIPELIRAFSNVENGFFSEFWILVFLDDVDELFHSLCALALAQ